MSNTNEQIIQIIPADGWFAQYRAADTVIKSRINDTLARRPPQAQMTKGLRP